MITMLLFPANRIHRNSSLILAFLLLSTGVLEVASAQDWARKMFSGFEHDFGTVAKNELAEHTFVIKNLYEEDMRIRGVTSSCTCTDVSLDKKVLKKDETANLLARFNSKNFVGPKQATITVAFDPPFNAEVQLTVRGSIRSDVMFEPGAIDFGSVSQDGLKSRENARQIQVTKFNNPNWQILDVKSTFPHVAVSLSSPIGFGNQLRYDMTVRLKETAPPGFVQSELIIIANDFGRTTEIPIKFSAKVASALQISPEILTIIAPQGSLIEKKIVIKAASEFRIKDVTCSNTSFSVKADAEKSSKVHFVKVTYSADQPPGRYEYDLEFVTDLNEKTEAQVRAIVEVIANDDAKD